MIAKTLITATLDGAALTAAPCGVCRELLSPLADAYQVDLATDGDEEFLLFTPRLTAAQLATLRPHRNCLLATVITLTTPQFFLIERRQPDGSWRPCDLRMLSGATGRRGWQLASHVPITRSNPSERPPDAPFLCPCTVFSSLYPWGYRRLIRPS